MTLAVLFDLDGTLVDSEPYWQAAETKIVEAHGKTWTQEEGDQQTGNALEVTAANVVRLKNLPYSTEEMIEMLVAGVLAEYREHGVPWLAGVEEMLAKLRDSGIKTAIVSASFSTLVEEVAAQAPAGSISCLISGDTPYAGQKPSGQPYLTAAATLGVDPADCLVVEDSLNGIQAGQDAGIVTVKVGDMDLAVKAAQAGMGADYGRYLEKQVHKLAGSGQLTPELVAEWTSRRSAGIGRGPFQAGEKVQLSDASGRLFTVTITEKGWFNVHKGSFPLGQLIGLPEGSVITSREGREYLALRPRRLDYALSMPRGAAIIYPKDAGQIIQMADIFTGAEVFECGVGSGALSLNLLNTIGPKGRLVSLEARPEFADIAQANVDIWFNGAHPAWHLLQGRLGETDPQDLALTGSEWAAAPSPLDGESYEQLRLKGQVGFDRAILDLLDPWEYLSDLEIMLRPGGVLCCYVTTIPQVSTLVEALRETGHWSECETWETMQRSWHVEGLAVRPDHRMVAHTGFLVTTRLLAPGCQAPQKPANQVKEKAIGAQWDANADWSVTTLGQRNPAPKKLRKVRNDAVAKAEYWVRSGRRTQIGSPTVQSEGGRNVAENPEATDRGGEANETVPTEPNVSAVAPE